jgi:glycosyltransferase involved in cell wall biosynthesis
MAIKVLELRSVAGTGGGPEKTILAGARHGAPDIDVIVCYLANQGDDVFPIGAQARALGLDYVELRERGAIDLSTWRALREVVRSRQIDIIHGHDYKTDLMAHWTARRAGIAALATAHGWTGHSWRERWIYYPAHRRLLARFAKTIAVSSEIKATIVRAGGTPSRIEVLLNGIDPARFRRDPGMRPPARAHYGLRELDVAIGAVGRLEPQKRFDLLIEAFAALARENPALHLLIAGEGSVRPALQAQIDRLGLASRARLVGQADVIPFHHSLDLFAQSSDYEGTPNVVLEAMALEPPIVATSVGGTGELMADDVHGLLIQPGSAGVIEGALRRALADAGGAAARARAARARVETDLSFARRMERLNDIYRELAARSGRG